MRAHSHHHNRIINQLALARLLSQAGNEIGWIMHAAIATALSGDPAWFAWVVAVRTATRIVIAPIAGQLADRVCRRRLAVASSMGTAASTWLMIAAPTQELLVAAGTAGAAASALGTPAMSAALVPLVGEEHVARASARSSTAMSIASIGGPAVGAIVLAHHNVVLAAVCVTLLELAAGAMLWKLPGNFGGAGDRLSRAAAGCSDTGWRRGFVLVWRLRVVRLLTVAHAIQCVGWGLITGGELALVIALGGDAADLGPVMAAWGGGAVLGGLVADRCSRHVEQARVFIASKVITGVIIATVTPQLTSTAGLAGLLAVIGALAVVSGTGWNASLQRQCGPDESRGRVLAAVTTMLMLTSVPGIAGAGLLVGPIGAHAVYTAGGVFVAAGALVLVPLLAPAPDAIPSRAG